MFGIGGSQGWAFLLYCGRNYPEDSRLKGGEDEQIVMPLSDAVLQFWSRTWEAFDKCGGRLKCEIV